MNIADAVVDLRVRVNNDVTDKQSSGYYSANAEGVIVKVNQNEIVVNFDTGIYKTHKLHPDDNDVSEWFVLASHVELI